MDIITPAQIRWQPVVGYEAFYEVSEYGHVRTLQKRHAQPAGKLLNPNADRNGYLAYHLTGKDGRKTHMAHRLVYRAFVGVIQDNTEIDHVDNCKQNNHYSNLQAISHQQNAEKAKRDNRIRIPKGVQMWNAKLDDTAVREIRRMRENGVKVRAIAKQFNVSHVAIVNILKRRTWTHIE